MLPVVEIYNSLPQEAATIREDIFLNEQGFSVEFDDIDNYATHILLRMGEEVVGTCRFFYSEERKSYAIGRVAVVKKYRGKGYGSMLIKAAEKEIVKLGGTKIYISSQCRASDFYASLGYKKTGSEYMDEFCPHIGMIKEVS